MDVQGNAVAGWAGQAGLETGETLGCLLKSTSKGFELTRGENSLTIRHAGSMVDNHNDGSLVGKDVGTGSDKLELSDDVVGDSLKVNVDFLGGNDSHVRAGDGAVGTTVDETPGSSRCPAVVLLDSVSGEAGSHTSGAIGSGRRHL